MHPWLIEDFADFQTFAGNSSYWASGVHTRLECDVDLDPNLPGRHTYGAAVAAWDTSYASGFQGTKFKAVFDGNGHSIGNMVIDVNDVDVDYLGLFGLVYGTEAEIRGLTMQNAWIVGSAWSWYVGSVCGEIKLWQHS